MPVAPAARPSVPDDPLRGPRAGRPRHRHGHPRPAREPQRAEQAHDVRAQRRLRRRQPSQRRQGDRAAGRRPALLLAGTTCGTRRASKQFDVSVRYGGFGREGQEGHMAWEEEVYFQMCWRWRNLPKPVIAAAQGKTIAGGLMLLWVADVIVAADDALFSDPGRRHGRQRRRVLRPPVGARGAQGQGAAVHRRLGDRRGGPPARHGQPRRAGGRAARRSRSGSPGASRSGPSFALKLAKESVNQALEAQGQLDGAEGRVLAPAPRARPQPDQVRDAGRPGPRAPDIGGRERGCGAATNHSPSPRAAAGRRLDRDAGADPDRGPPLVRLPRLRRHDQPRHRDRGRGDDGCALPLPRSKADLYGEVYAQVQDLVYGEFEKAFAHEGFRTASEPCSTLQWRSTSATRRWPASSSACRPRSSVTRSCGRCSARWPAAPPVPPPAGR